jgi:NDP-hexose-3-ketoreductase
MTSLSHPGIPIRFGVMGCSAFALRAMIPAFCQNPKTELIAIASRDEAKAAKAASAHGCNAIDGYQALLEIPGLDAVYIPLPTGLHEEWVHRALDAGKHVLIEKSLASDFTTASSMIEKARGLGLLVLENFLFPRHTQHAWVQNQIASGTIGDCRIFRATFTIPPLNADNFRYNSTLGGGALLDTGAYMVKSALSFLGPNLRILVSTLEIDPKRDIDIRGTATFINDNGMIAQTAWGFDTSYQCSWEFIGSQGRILCSRALTPPPDFEPQVRIESPKGHSDIHLPSDNHYLKQIDHFTRTLRNSEDISAELDSCLLQARILEAVKAAASVHQVRS